MPELHCVIVLLLVGFHCARGFITLKPNVLLHYKTVLNAKGGGTSGDGDAVSRRRRRRAGESAPTRVDQVPPTATSIASPSEADSDLMNPDGSKSLESMFGLGNDQLRELMEQELPVPREDLSTRKQVNAEVVDKNKVFRLPDLEGFMADDAVKKTPKGQREQAESMQADKSKRVDRSNQEEYLRVMQLNPFADADDTMFLDEYDIIPSIFGSGKLLNIPVPYLQTGHGILLIVTLLSALVYAPGNPLTEFPAEIRNFLKQGLSVTYSINTVLAVNAFFKAKAKNLPAIFWAAKCFLLGGVAFFEISSAVDPRDLNKIDPSDRKSKRR